MPSTHTTPPTGEQPGAWQLDGAQTALLETLFDRMPMGIAIFDQDFMLRRFNPTWAEYVERYTPVAASEVVPGGHLMELIPGGGELLAFFQRVLRGETISVDSLRIENYGVVSYWDAVFSPLIEDGEVKGIIDVAIDATERVLAYQKLEERVAARTRELSTLLEMSHNMTAILEMEPLLGLILDQLRMVVEYSAATVFRLAGDDLIILAYRGPIKQEDLAELRLPLSRAAANREVIETHKPIIIPDVHGNTQLARAFQKSAGEHLETTFSYIRSWMGVPLTIRERIIGMLTLDHIEPGYYSEHQADLALAFANQAAVAIENAQLYEQASELAAINERQRLARELHDAVTQTLFSASLIAEVLPRLYERDPDEGENRLEELRELTRGALAEMRTLLMELRPAALTEVGLSDLLHQLAEAINGRARIPVQVDIDGETCLLPPEVQVTLYRITQEALNNVAKHSGATQVTISMRCDQGGVEISVQDDGQGFVLADVPPDRLGLGIMQERAEEIGAELAIDSQRGQGTRIMVRWAGRFEEEFA